MPLMGSLFTDQMGQVEDLLRKHLGLFKEMFKHYGLRNQDDPGDVNNKQQKEAKKARMSRVGITLGKEQQTSAKLVAEGLDASHMLDLQGLMHIYKDCHLRTARFLPRDVEAIFHEVKVEAHELYLAQQAKEQEAKEAKEQALKAEKGEKVDKRSPKAAAALRRTSTIKT